MKLPSYKWLFKKTDRLGVTYEYAQTPDGAIYQRNTASDDRNNWNLRVNAGNIEIWNHVKQIIDEGGN